MRSLLLSMLTSPIQINVIIGTLALVTIGCDGARRCYVDDNATFQEALESGACDEVVLLESDIESIDVEVDELPAWVAIMMSHNERLRDVRLILPAASKVEIFQNPALQAIEVTSNSMLISGDSPDLEQVTFSAALDDGVAFNSSLHMAGRTTESLTRLNINCAGTCDSHVLLLDRYSAPEDTIEVNVSGSPLSHLYISPTYVTQGIELFSGFGVPTRSAQVLSPQDPTVMASYETWLRDNGFDGVFHGCVGPSECEEVEVPKEP